MATLRVTCVEDHGREGSRGSELIGKGGEQRPTGMDLQSVHTGP